MSIKLISAVSCNGVIGKENKLPFHYPEDLKFFRKMTIDATVIMGRKTFESIGRLLPKRRNIIVTTQSMTIEGAEVVNSFRDAIDIASTPIPAVAIIDKNGNQVIPENKDNIWLIGGSSIYSEGIYGNIVDEIYLTLVPDHIEGNNLIHFPWINPIHYKVVEYIDLENSKLKVAHYVKNT